jgi:hypothetical protein
MRGEAREGKARQSKARHAKNGKARQGKTRNGRLREEKHLGQVGAPETRQRPYRERRVQQARTRALHPPRRRGAPSRPRGSAPAALAPICFFLTIFFSFFLGLSC